MAKGMLPKGEKTAAQTALKKHGRRSIFEAPPADHVKRTLGESDRGVLVLMGSLIEDGLEWRLREVLVGANDSQKDTLFEFTGPLGTFSSKIVFAHALGLISAPVRDIIDVMRHMRNGAAHIQQDISFETEEIASAVQAIMGENTNAIIQKGGGKAARDSFVLAGIMMFQVVTTSKLDPGDPHDAALQSALDYIDKHERVPVAEAAALQKMLPA